MIHQHIHLAADQKPLGGFHEWKQLSARFLALCVGLVFNNISLSQFITGNGKLCIEVFNPSPSQTSLSLKLSSFKV